MDGKLTASSSRGLEITFLSRDFTVQEYTHSDLPFQLLKHKMKS